VSKTSFSNNKTKRGIESNYLQRLAENWPEPREQLHHGGWKTTKDLVKNMEIKEKFQILDCCCGEGATACWIAKKYQNKGVSVSGFDILEQAIRTAEKKAIEQGVNENTDFRVADIFNIPFNISSFDIIYGQDPDGLANYNRFLAFRELFRILKPKGMLIFHLWIPFINYPKEDLMIFENTTIESGYPFMARLSLKEFIEDMKYAGFTSIEYEDMSKDYYEHVKKLKKKIEANGNKLDVWYSMLYDSFKKGNKIGVKIKGFKVD